MRCSFSLIALPALQICCQQRTHDVAYQVLRDLIASHTQFLVLVLLSIVDIPQFAANMDPSVLTTLKILITGESGVGKSRYVIILDIFLWRILIFSSRLLKLIILSDTKYLSCTLNEVYRFLLKYLAMWILSAFYKFSKR